MRDKLKIFSLLILILSAGEILAGNINIQSDALNILERGVKNEFYGNVRVRGEGIELTSGRAVSEVREGIITARENVRIIYSSGTLKLDGKSEEARILEREKKFYLTGNTRTVYYSEDDTPTVTYADSVEVFYKQPLQAFFVGGVRVEQADALINSEKAVYDDGVREILFTGSPEGESRSEGERINYSGELIRVSLETERITMEGGARVIMEMLNES